MSCYTIGIDFGTQSGRALLVDTRNGKELAFSECKYPHGLITGTLPCGNIPLPCDYVLQEPYDYIEILKKIIPEVIHKAGIEKKDVKGIAVDCTTSTVVAVDNDGVPMCTYEKYRSEPHAYVKLWKHHGATEEAAIINKAAKKTGQEWTDRFGGIISSEWMYSKILETLRKAPGVYNDTAYFTEVGDWLSWILTGKQVRSYGYAAYKAAYIIENGGFPDKKFFEACDEKFTNVVDEKLKAPLAKTNETVGYVNAKSAEMFGLCEGTVVACPMADGHTVSIGLGLDRDGDMCGVFGTSLSLMSITERFAPVKGVCGIVKDGLIPGFYGYASGLGCVGDLYAWCADNIMTADYYEEAKERGIAPLKLLIEKAATTKVGESGLVALSWFNGNKSVLVDHRLSGMILGMTLRTKPEEIMRAMIESTAYGARKIIDNFSDAGANIKRFIAAGGIARKDPFTMQLFSDVLGMEIPVSSSTQVPALSEAIQASVAAGVYGSLEEAQAKMLPKIEKVYKPITGNSKIYDKLYSEFSTLHDYFGRGQNEVMHRLRDITK